MILESLRPDRGVFLKFSGRFEEGRLMHPTGSSTIPTRGFSDFEFKVRIIFMFGIVL